MTPTIGFNKKILSTLIAACVASSAFVGSSSAFAESGSVEEVLVSGVRGAQERAIDIKRNSAEIVDSVAAEDMGKLPDITIADSLQRITGIQISRDAGQEGGLVSIRGMQQIQSTLNGETFLTAKSLTDNKADFTDIPSSLVSGINVYKSQSATNVEGGISGSIDMLTKRSLSFDEGLTLAASAKVSNGNVSKSTDPDINGVIAWKANDNIASSLALSYSDSTLSDNRGVQTVDRAVESSWGCPGGNCQDLDGDGKLSSEILHGATWNSNVQTRETARERLGLVYNFNMMLNDSLELNTDVMYNDMTEKSAGQFLYLTNGTDRSQFHNYQATTGKPAFPASGLQDASAIGQSAYATEYNTNISGLRAGVLGDYRDTSALNTNVELKYDAGEAFTGALRWVHGTAESTDNALTLAGVTYKKAVPRTAGGAAVELNPGGIDNGAIYPINVKLNAENVGFSVDPALAALASKESAWYLHSGWIDGGYQEATSDVIRADGNFKFADSGLTSVDFGLRLSDRSTTNDSFSFFSPSGYIKNGVELLNKYHEVGYALGQAGSTGTAAGATYDPLKVFTFNDPKLQGYIHQVSDFGKAVSGLNLSIPMINVDKIDDPVAFENMLYGTGQQINNPDKSYVVDESKQSLHVKFNFDAAINDAVSMSGNAGLRYVKIDLTVNRNITNSTQLNPTILAGTDPNHTTYKDLGDEATDVSYNYALPSINLNFDIGDEWKIKAAYNETLQLQDLKSLGGGTTASYKGQANGESFQRINSVENNGNPNLKPWNAGIFSLAGEWYPTDTAIVTLGYFHMDIESFTFRDSLLDTSLKDTDGVARDGAPVYTVQNGKGGAVEGYEMAYQQSLDFLPGFLANTGVTLNYTYSPSKGSTKLNDGSDAPFGSTAKNQANAIVWYQADKWQARIAANYISEQYNGQFRDWMTSNNPNGLNEWIKPQLFVDLSGSYDVTEAVQVSFSANNILSENKIQYRQWEDNISQYDLYERRLTAGVTAKF
jgi:iron complex outermembrane recepter protein